jgi:hypothetical protein
MAFWIARSRRSPTLATRRTVPRIACVAERSALSKAHVNDDGLSQTWAADVEARSSRAR